MKTHRLKKIKSVKPRKMTPDISAADLEMLEDAYEEKVISIEEVMDLLL